ncbi:hypothetical protein HDU96_008946 [Phlyctochytrium bullatum]|nr:hypothetical protein HDU96_008946 [Phlyctochytrium bullatum]
MGDRNGLSDPASRDHPPPPSTSPPRPPPPARRIHPLATVTTLPREDRTPQASSSIISPPAPASATSVDAFLLPSNIGSAVQLQINDSKTASVTSTSGLQGNVLPTTHQTNFRAVLWTGTPTGEERNVGRTSVMAYFAAPLSGKTDRAIILLTDAFGWKLPTFRLIADELAHRTHSLVIIPDLLEGGLYLTSPQLIAPPPPKPPQPPSLFTTFTTFVSQSLSYASTLPNLANVLTRFTESTVLPILDRILCSLVADHGIDPNRIGVQGYGWGGNLAIALGGRYNPSELPAVTAPSTGAPTTTPPPRIACFSVADPTHLTGIFSIRKLKVPSLWCVTSQDHSGFPLAFRVAAERTLMVEKKTAPGGAGSGTAFVVFDEMPPGFASRGHWGQEPRGIAEAADEALERACEFFREMLRG